MGTLIAALRPGMPASKGMTACAARPIPPDRPLELASFAKFRDGQRGLEVAEESRFRQDRVPLRKGDLLLDVPGRATPDLKSLLKLDEPGAGVLPSCPGDPMGIGIERAGKRMELCFPLPSYFGRFFDGPGGEESSRCSGFPVAFDADISLSADECGGPVVDRSGRVIGITVARRRAGVYVIPAAAARQVALTLMR